MVKGIVTFAHTVLNVDKISGFKDTVLKNRKQDYSKKRRIGFYRMHVEQKFFQKEMAALSWVVKHYAVNRLFIQTTARTVTIHNSITEKLFIQTDHVLHTLSRPTQRVGYCTIILQTKTSRN